MKKLLCWLGMLTMSAALAAQVLPAKIIVARDNVDIDYPPREFHENGVLTGFHVDVVTEVAKQLGMVVEWKEVPWARAQLLVQKGEVDAISVLSHNKEREAWAIFHPDNVLSSNQFSLVLPKSSLGERTKGLDVTDMLKGKSLLVVRGFPIPQTVKDAQAKLVEAPNVESFFSMLALGRAEMGMTTRAIFDSKYQALGDQGDLALFPQPVQVSDAFLAFSLARQDSGLSGKFAVALHAFKKMPRYLELKKKYRQ
jgi:polar amino acid transport system substrate-binding protein